MIVHSWGIPWCRAQSLVESHEPFALILRSLQTRTQLDRSSVRADVCSQLSHRKSANIPGRPEGHPRGETRRLAASRGQCAVLNLGNGSDFAVAVRFVAHRALSFEDCAL